MRRTGQAGAAWVAILQSEHPSLKFVRDWARGVIRGKRAEVQYGHRTLASACKALGISERTWFRIGQLL